MDYYDTTPEQVAAAAKRFGISQYTAHALLERGHTEDEIDRMDASLMFREFCEWHGLIGWGSTLEATLDECREAQTTNTDSEGSAHG